MTTKQTKKSVKKRGPQCKCLESINKALEEDSVNLKIEEGLYMDWDRGTTFTLPIISVKKRDSKKRGRLGSITPSYCPFCGKKYNL